MFCRKTLRLISTFWINAIGLYCKKNINYSKCYLLLKVIHNFYVVLISFQKFNNIKWRILHVEASSREIAAINHPCYHQVFHSLSCLVNTPDSNGIQTSLIKCLALFPSVADLSSLQFLSLLSKYLYVSMCFILYLFESFSFTILISLNSTAVTTIVFSASQSKYGSVNRTLMVSFLWSASHGKGPAFN